MNKYKLFFAAAGLLAPLMLAPASRAQDATGKIAGNITDVSGAVISGAKVAVTNLDIQTTKRA